MLISLKIFKASFTWSSWLLDGLRSLGSSNPRLWKLQEICITLVILVETSYLKSSFS
jgi:hypothetical protein